MFDLKALILFLFVTTIPVFSQIGIGTTEPNETAILDIFSSNKGVLIPRLSTSQRDLIANPAIGLMIYNTTEKCSQAFFGLSVTPNWQCVDADHLKLTTECPENQFSGLYIEDLPCDSNNTLRVLLINNESRTKYLTFSTSDISLSGARGGLIISDVNITNATLETGDSIEVTYTFEGTPTSFGDLLVEWRNGVSFCNTSVFIHEGGSATINSPVVEEIVSVNNTLPAYTIAGSLDTSVSIIIPYSGGIGKYVGYTSDFVQNNTGTGHNGDQNGFRLTYEGGTFSANGFIQATIEVDGDSVFNAKQLVFGERDTVASLDIIINGLNQVLFISLLMVVFWIEILLILFINLFTFLLKLLMGNSG